MDLYTIITHNTLDKIARNCPRALSCFVHLLTRASDEGKVIFHKQQIIDDLSESYVKFKNDLRSLAREDLLEWHERNGALHVILALPKELDAS